ncbi:unnamed protein product [Discosporangium mesarthrocarpum]
MVILHLLYSVFFAWSLSTVAQSFFVSPALSLVGEGRLPLTQKATTPTRQAGFVMVSSSKPFDVVVLGATGFTGCLVAKYILTTYGASPPGFKWAVVGRSEEKLKALKDRLAAEVDEAATSIPSITADTNDETSLKDLVAKTKVVMTTVGPYRTYGNKVVAACAGAGVHCVDLTGESLWVRDVIEKHHAEAERTGAKIVPSCGFDSVPADLGAFMMVEHMKKIHARSPDIVKYMCDDAKGGFSGGTMATVLDVMDLAWKGGGAIRKQMNDPLLLIPKDKALSTAEVPPVSPFGYDSDIPGWTAPFPAASHDSKLVYRSASLLNYGSSFKYTEVMAYKGRVKALLTSLLVTTALTLGGIFLFFPPTRFLLKRFVIPAPGQGPSKKARDEGYFWNNWVAKAGSGADEVVIRGVVGSDKGDPGYKETAKMLAESGLCLALDSDKIVWKSGGVLTTASAMGHPLLERLRKAGMTWTVEG